MNTTKKQHNWSEFLKLFGEQYKTRPTRLGVFRKEFGTTTDYWLEDGLPLAGIAVEPRGENGLSVEIMLGDASGAESKHMTHSVAGALFVKIILSRDGEADGLEIEDTEGQTTILRFEN